MHAGGVQGSGSQPALPCSAGALLASQVPNDPGPCTAAGMHGCSWHDLSHNRSSLHMSTAPTAPFCVEVQGWIICALAARCEAREVLACTCLPHMGGSFINSVTLLVIPGCAGGHRTARLQKSQQAACMEALGHGSAHPRQCLEHSITIQAGPCKHYTLTHIGNEAHVGCRCKCEALQPTDTHDSTVSASP